MENRQEMPIVLEVIGTDRRMEIQIKTDKTPLGCRLSCAVRSTGVSDMRELLNLSDALRKGIRATSDFLLFDSGIAHALLNLAESANNEERRFRAILKAEEVIASMNTILSKIAVGDEQRVLIEQARDGLQARLDRTTSAAPVHLA